MMNNYRIIKEDNKFYPQYYHKSWWSFFSGWRYFEELCFGSFNPPTPDAYEDVFFITEQEAIDFIEKQSKTTTEVVYES